MFGDIKTKFRLFSLQTLMFAGLSSARSVTTRRDPNRRGNTWITALTFAMTLLVITFAPTTSSHAQNADAGDVATGLVGHWRLDETSGSTIIDSSPTGNNGAWIDNDNNDVTEESILGTIKNGLRANGLGSQNYVSIPNNGVYSAGTIGSISISGWFNMNTQTSGEDLHIFKEGGGTTFIFFGLTNGRVISRMRGSDGVFVTFTVGNIGEFSDGKWHHATVTVDRNTNRTTIYVDGTERNWMDNSGHTGTLGPDTTSSITIRNNDSIDDVRYYNRALSADDVALLYRSYSGPYADAAGTCNAAHEAVIIFNHDKRVMQYCNGTDWVNVGEEQEVPSASGLVGHWPLDDTDTTVLANIGPNGAMAGGLDGANDSVAARNGNGLRFDGVDDAVNLGNTGIVNNIFNSGGTIAAWFWIDPATAPGFRFFDKNNNSPINRGYLISYEAGSVLRISRHRTGTEGIWETTTTVPTSEWVHVAIAYDASATANDPDIYFNSVLQSITETSTPTGTVYDDSAHNLGVGNRDDLGRPLNGILDDIRIYDSVLSATEIENIYNAHALAATGCTSPRGKAGEMDYNLDEGVMQYCNGSSWINMGPKSAEAGASAADLSPTAPTSGLIGHWTLDDTNTTAIDSTGANSGTMVGGLDGATNSVDGKINTSLNFDGADDYIQIPDSATLSFGDGATSQELSVCSWVNAADMTNFAIASKCRDNGAGDCEFSFGTHDADELRFNITDSNINDRIGLLSSSALTADEGAWNHYCGTYDGTNTNAGITLYRNGVALGTASNNSGSFTAVEDTNSTIDIGSLMRSSGAFNEWADGQIDDVRVYSRELTATEISDLYKSSSLAGHWKLDETTGTTAADGSGNGNDGTVNGTDFDTDSVAGMSGTAMNFDGTSDFIETSSDDILDPDTFTACAWVRRTGPGSGQPWQEVFGNAVFQTHGWHLNFEPEATTAQFYLNRSGARDAVSVNIDTAQWNHICASYDGTNARLYANGVLGGGPTAATVVDSTDSFYLGDAGPNQGDGLEGDIDDMRIYNRALSAAEIADLYSTTGGEAVSLQDTSCPNIGDVCSGGSFYVGVHPVDGDHLYTTASDDSTNTEWSTLTVDLNLDNIYDGRANQNWIVNNTTLSDYPAFELCENLNRHGHGDWYLPAIDELDTVYSNLRIAPADGDPDNPVSGCGGSIGSGVVASGTFTGPQEATFSGSTYLSSTESSDLWACGIGFAPSSSGRHFGNRNKTNTGYRTRCMRRATSTLSTCSSPTGVGGEIVYNDDFNIMQYCNGSEWVAMGSDYSGSATVYGSDTTPDAFSFTADTDVVVSTVSTSNSININGIDAVTSVSVSGDGSPEININGGGWVTSGNITNGQSLQVRLTSSGSNSTTSTATVDVGGVAADYDVTTAAGADPCETGAIGTVCADGAIYAGTTVGGARFYAAPSDESGTYIYGGYTTDVNGDNASVAPELFDDGLANTNMLINSGAGDHEAAQACEDRAGTGWYLPARDELDTVWNNLVNGAPDGNSDNITDDFGFNISGDYPDGWYWSSSEGGEYSSWRQWFSSGLQNYGTKTNGIVVRCVRR